MKGWESNCVPFFLYGYLVVPAQFVENYSFSIELNWHPCLKSLDHKWKGLFWTLQSLPLIYMSNLMSVPHCLDFCNSVVTLEIRNCESSNFILFQNCFDSSCPLHFHLNFRISFSVFAKKSQLGFDWGYIGYVDQFGEYYNLNNIKSSSDWTWGFFPLIWIF